MNYNIMHQSLPGSQSLSQLSWMHTSSYVEAHLSYVFLASSSFDAGVSSAMPKIFWTLAIITTS